MDGLERRLWRRVVDTPPPPQRNVPILAVVVGILVAWLIFRVVLYAFA